MFEAWNNSALTQWLNGFLWGFPSAEIFHLVMLCTFFGGMMMLDLRLLGFNRFISSSVLMKYILKCVWIAFVGVVISGSLLFQFMPLEYSRNPAFRIKMVVIVLAGLNALWMHMAHLKNIDQWDLDTPPLGVRISAFISMGLWITVLGCGRLIAYYYGF